MNPWDVEDPANPPIEKIAYLVALHALLVGDQQAGEDAYGLDALERNLLEVAIRSVYARAARDGLVPREGLLREELRRRAHDEAEAGAEEVAAVLRTLGERIASFVEEGSYAYLLDRETTVPERRAAGRLRHAQGAARAPGRGAVRARRARHATHRAPRRRAAARDRRRPVRGPLDAGHR